MSTSLLTLRLRDEKFSELLEELREHFSIRAISPSNTIEDIMYRAGQASVVDYLEQKFTEE